MFIPQADVHATIPPLPLDKLPRFSLDMAGIAALLGGDNATSAIAAVHVYGNRRWLGWHNNPGSFQIARRLRSFTKYLSPRSSHGVHVDPMALYGSESRKGPKFRAAHSGTVIEETGHLSALLMKECAALDSEGRVVPGRTTHPVSITIADLGRAPPFEVHPARSSASTLFFASVPIAASIAACVLCAVCEDWFASSLILVGIIASGVSCFVLGSADFVFTHPESATGSPAGDGILGSGEDIVLLRGTEIAVNSITRGRFSLRFSNEVHYTLTRWCSVLFFVQCVTQLLLVPQASLFGQVLFLVSIGVSALYNHWLASSDEEKLLSKILFERVLENPMLTKYTLGTRTTAVVFVLLVLRLQDPTGLLNELLPNDTKVWRHWKTTVLEHLRQHGDQSFSFESLNVGDLNGFTQHERELLQSLYSDARAAQVGYGDYLRAGIDSL